MDLVKTINDPVHGTIGITKLESRLINTEAFQRLRNVKHLSLAYLVYPSANFSRLSHSIGVCHVTGRLLESLRKNSPVHALDEREQQVYRLAGLFHDIGHYPFSHPMEDAVKNYCAEKKMLVAEPTPKTETGKYEYYNHEKVGALVLDNDPEIGKILNEEKIEPREIHRIFNREDPPKFANLISSDFDADRIDYLLRTAHHTGLPYGKVDINYLIGQLRAGKFEETTWLYLDHKALKAADHFLLSRYFDNHQAAFHKTVAGFEWMLKDALQGLLEHDLIDCDVSASRQKIKNQTWLQFDDDHVTHQMYKLTTSKGVDEITKLVTSSLLKRKPPKQLVEFEELGEKGKTPFADKKKLVRTLVKELAKQYDIDERLWRVWSKTVSPTKVGAHFSFDETGDIDQDKKEQTIQVFDKHEKKPKAIVSMKESLMSILSNYEYNALRLYLLVPPEKMSLLEEIEKKVFDALHD